MNGIRIVVNAIVVSTSMVERQKESEGLNEGL
jgi:hypothetical protein